jgi:hypothetical protein
VAVPFCARATRGEPMAARYVTWEDFVKSETNDAADLAKGAGDWAKLREHSSYHTDTLADRMML